MRESDWVEIMATALRLSLSNTPYKSCAVEVGKRIAYGFEITSYVGNQPQPSINEYETDLAILEHEDDDVWKPRVIIEAKVRGRDETIYRADL